MAKDFGTLLRKFREEAGISMGDTARHLGISLPYLSDVERGNRAPLASGRIRDAAGFLGLEGKQVEALLEAAARSRGVFELDASNVGPRARAVGAALMRGWPALEDEDLAGIEEILRRRNLGESD